jgi:hypothetical protein
MFWAPVRFWTSLNLRSLSGGHRPVFRSSDKAEFLRGVPLRNPSDINNDQPGSLQQPPWLWPNLLSLDAPLIAILWLHLFAASEHIEIASSVTLVLGLTVWIIYVADRIFDGLRVDGRSDQAARHRFHRTHRNVFLLVLIAALALIVWECLQLDACTLQFGTLLSLIVAVYFSAVHVAGSRLRFPKEAVVALVFAIGTFFPMWIHVQRSTAAMAISLLLFILICWLNVVIIEYAEWAALERGRAKTPHGSTIAAGAHLPSIGIVTALSVAAISLIFPLRVEQPVMLAVLLSAIALAMLGSYWQRLSLNALRVLADAALLSPALIFLFAHR